MNPLSFVENLASTAARDTANAAQSLEQQIVNTTQGVEQGAGQLLGGMVHDALGLPQMALNLLWYSGYTIIGLMLILAGVSLMFGWIASDAVDDLGDKLGDAIGTVLGDKQSNAAGAGAVASKGAAVAEEAAVV